MPAMLFCFIILNVLLQHIVSGEAPLVETNFGTVKGSYKTSYFGKKFSSFEGVPYAKPPIGDLRFKEPQAVEPWIGIWNATQKHACLQVNLMSGKSKRAFSGYEDCLYLNIFVPNETPNPEDNLDVVVHIHGGAFVLGSNQMGQPHLLMDRNVIVVAVNYRLSVFGFLCTQDNAVSCNNGLKDQTFALKWIKENIRNFGGNPDSVTIEGLSAGGASVHYHYISPLSKGLFHRGFSQSGSSLNPWALSKRPLQHATLLAKNLGCPESPTSILVECLRRRPANVIADALWDFYEFLWFPMAPFAPSVEPAGEGAFLPDHPYKLLKSGRVNAVPYVQSVTTNEGATFVMLTGLQRQLYLLDEDWDRKIHYILETVYTVEEENKKSVADKVREHYGLTERINNKQLRELSQIFSDRYFLADFQRTSQLQAKVAPVYNFVIGFSGEHSAIKKLARATDLQGVFHGDDALYLHAPADKLSESEEAVIKIYLDMLESFIKTGKPEIEGVIWNPAESSGEFNYVYIGGPEDIQINSTQYFGGIDFWDSLPTLEYDKLVSVRDEL